MSIESKISRIATENPILLMHLRDILKELGLSASIHRHQFSDDEKRTIRKLQSLHEEGDPMKAIYELFGYRSTPDLERGVEYLERGGRYLAVGCHNSGKTIYLGAGYMFGWKFLCQGSKILNDEYQGNILALIANKQDQILSTSWKCIRNAGKSAANRGWIIPGYGSKDSSDISVIWRLIPNQWYITAETFQKPPKSSTSPILHQSSGLKHPSGILVWFEEAHTLPHQIFTTVKGWGTQVEFGALNPYEAGGGAYNMIESGQFSFTDYSYLRHPDVINRKVTMPGAANHVDLEDDMRSPLHVKCLGDTPPDLNKMDFLYALPDVEEDDVEGPRNDGIPGHPLAKVKTYRPISPEFIAGKLGKYPKGQDNSVFYEDMWGKALDLHSTLNKPSRPPDVVGVDMAEGGPDRIVAYPRWGQSCYSLWSRYQSSLSSKKSHSDSIEEALKCRGCDGRGCDRCFGGKDYIYFGSPVEVPKSTDPHNLSRNIISSFGVSRYYLDSSGGYLVVSPMKRLGIDSDTVSFGSSPPRSLKGQREFLNMRAAMYGNLACGMLLECVALNPSRELKSSCRVLKWIPYTRTVRGNNKILWRLQDKDEVRSAIGMSPDESDAWSLTEGWPKTSVSGGGIDTGI